MNIDKFKREDGKYVNSLGEVWEDSAEFLHGSVCGFCCCGDLENSLRFVRDVLWHVRDLKESVWKQKKAYEEWKTEGRKITDNRSLIFAYYVLTEKDFLEHGGSVPGWLTESGEELLADINELFPREDRT